MGYLFVKKNQSYSYYAVVKLKMFSLTGVGASYFSISGRLALFSFSWLVCFVVSVLVIPRS